MRRFFGFGYHMEQEVLFWLISFGYVYRKRSPSSSYSIAKKLVKTNYNFFDQTFRIVLLLLKLLIFLHHCSLHLLPLSLSMFVFLSKRKVERVKKYWSSPYINNLVKNRWMDNISFVKKVKFNGYYMRARVFSIVMISKIIWLLTRFILDKQI